MGLSPSKSTFLYRRYSPNWPEPHHTAILNSRCLKLRPFFLSSLDVFHSYLQEKRAKGQGDVKGFWRASHSVCHSVQTCCSHFVTVVLISCQIVSYSKTITSLVLLQFNFVLCMYKDRNANILMKAH